MTLSPGHTPGPSFADVVNGATDEARSFVLPLIDSVRDGVFDPRNKRVKLYGFSAAELNQCAPCGRLLDDNRHRESFSKLTVYALDDDPLWSNMGFRKEAAIEGYFADGRDAFLWCRYSDMERSRDPTEEARLAIVAMAKEKVPENEALPDGWRSEGACADNAGDIARVLQETFDEYPTPLDTATIHRVIERQTSRFRLIRDDRNEMRALASAEIDHVRRNAELTDCATLPAARGKGLMTRLLLDLEADVRERLGITDLYTIARAQEAGINCAFTKAGFHYTGCLVNNCRMPGGWESMNVWCKRSERKVSIH